MNDLYRQKGELITQLELLQARLNQVNQAIAEQLNKAQVPQEVPCPTTPSP
jgi:hypothetical protein